MANLSSYTKLWDDLTSATAEAYTQTGEFRDNVFDSIPLFAHMVSGDRYIPADGGASIIEPISLDASNGAMAYDGYDELDTSPSSAGTAASFPWAHYSAPITVAHTERDINAGKFEIINLVKARMRHAEAGLRDLMSTDLHGTNDGSSKGLIGIRALVASDPTSVSVGNIATSISAWENQADATSITFSTDGESEMTSMFNTCTFGGKRPTLICMTQALHEEYEAAVRADGRLMMPATRGDTGVEELGFKRVPVIFDRDQTAASILYLNTKDGLKLRYNPRNNFKLSEPRVPANQHASVWHVSVSLQLTTAERRLNGVQSDVT